MNKYLLRIILAAFLFAAVATAIYYRDSFNIASIEQWINQAGWWAPALFVFVYVLATVLFLPGSVFTLAGGVIFGPVFGSLYNLIGASIGAALSFLIARYLASDIVPQHSGGKLKQLISGVEAEGWRFVAFVRLVPVFPFNVLNYALGLTKIRFAEYLLASAVFMIPGTIAYTYIGYAGREALGDGEGLIQTILIALALFAIILFLPRFIANFRRGPSIDINELKRRIKQQETLILDVRSEAEFLSVGHIEGALNIPVEVLEQQLPMHVLEQSVSVICKTDRRSAKAAGILLKHGFQDVRVVKGGMTAYYSTC